jgi:hypothetical protein
MPKRKTLLTQLSQLPGTLTEREAPVSDEKPGYWSREKFEERLVKNTLEQLDYLDDAEKMIGRDPKTVGDLWAVIKADNARPLSEQQRDINEILNKKVSAISKALGLLPKRKK